MLVFCFALWTSLLVSKMQRFIHTDVFIYIIELFFLDWIFDFWDDAQIIFYTEI